MSEVRGEMLLRKLPKPVADSLTSEQIAAIRRASGDIPQRRHPIDSRFSLRLPFLGTVYCVLLIGKEKRSSQRRSSDRALKPTDRIGATVLIALITAGLLVAALVGILFENAILSS
ncbi:MAG TPA: hypothetical protein VGM59_13430 [Dongiaceae bacterium]